MLVFAAGFVFSFLGSIPPGTLNLSVIQLSLEGHKTAALRFALAAALFEFPYAYAAVEFEQVVTSSPWVIGNFRLLAAVVMLILGLTNIIVHLRKVDMPEKISAKKSGFRKGAVLSILNPLAIPFWIGVTAYLKNQEWISLPGYQQILIYISGISVGTFVLLVLLTLLGTKLGPFFRQNKLVNIIPGLVFLILGAYALFQYIALQ